MKSSMNLKIERREFSITDQMLPSARDCVSRIPELKSINWQSIQKRSKGRKDWLFDLRAPYFLFFLFFFLWGPPYRTVYYNSVKKGINKALQPYHISMNLPEVPHPTSAPYIRKHASRRYYYFYVSWHETMAFFRILFWFNEKLQTLQEIEVVTHSQLISLPTK